MDAMQRMIKVIEVLNRVEFSCERREACRVSLQVVGGVDHRG